MIINITNRKNKVSEGVKERIENWLEDRQARYDIITSAQVTLDKTEQHDEAEATIHAAGRDIFARATGPNMYAALDALGDKLDRQLSKIREKQLHKKGAHKVSENLIVEEPSMVDDLEEDDIINNIDSVELVESKEAVA